jgi:hypothetical protein
MKNVDTPTVLAHLKTRLPNLLTLFILLIMLVLFMYLILPDMVFLKDVDVSSNFNLYQVLRIFVPLMSVFIIFEISRQMAPIIDEVSDYIIYNLPGIRTVEKISIRRILSDFTYIIIAILFISTLSNLVSQWSHFFGIIFSVIALSVILFLIYDIVKVIYFLLEKSVSRIDVNSRLNSKHKENKK